jgi:hypothetical protein
MKVIAILIEKKSMNKLKQRIFFLVGMILILLIISIFLILNFIFGNYSKVNQFDIITFFGAIIGLTGFISTAFFNRKILLENQNFTEIDLESSKGQQIKIKYIRKIKIMIFLAFIGFIIAFGAVIINNLT